MFGFLSKTLGCRTVRISLIRKLYCQPLLTSFRFISSDKTANEDSLTVSYLINSCGLSPESALSVSKHIHLKTPRKPDSVLSFLKEQGFSSTQISNLVVKYPRVLLCNPDKTILPKIQFFYSKGLSFSDIYKILSSSPLIFGRSLNNGIIPNFDFLEELLYQSDRMAVKAIKRCSYILYANPKTQFSPKINFLSDIGVPRSSIVQLFHYWLTTFVSNFDKFKRKVQKVKEMGFDPTKVVFFQAVAVLMAMKKATWERKVNMYKRWDWSEEEILGAFRKQPLIMAASENKLMGLMDLFVNRLGWEPLVIAGRPVLIGLSLEKRLIPRAAVLQFLISKGLIKKSFRCTNFFESTEEKFLEKYIVHYAESSQILKLYREKVKLLGKQQNGREDTVEI